MQRMTTARLDGSDGPCFVWRSEVIAVDGKIARAEASAVE
tara:strand:+ start:2959 stop:3078 length:120 start_codon:yes stop_codon:yes gene_type:complete